MTLKERCSGQGEIPRAKLAIIVEKRVTSLQIAPSRTKERKKESKNKHRHDSSDDEEDEMKIENKKYGKKNSHEKKTKLFPKKKGNTKRSFLVEK